MTSSTPSATTPRAPSEPGSVGADNPTISYPGAESLLSSLETLTRHRNLELQLHDQLGDFRAQLRHDLYHLADSLTEFIAQIPTHILQSTGTFEQLQGDIHRILDRRECIAEREVALSAAVYRGQNFFQAILDKAQLVQAGPRSPHVALSGAGPIEDEIDAEAILTIAPEESSGCEGPLQRFYDKSGDVKVITERLNKASLKYREEIAQHQFDLDRDLTPQEPLDIIESRGNTKVKALQLDLQNATHERDLAKQECDEQGINTEEYKKNLEMPDDEGEYGLIDAVSASTELGTYSNSNLHRLSPALYSKADSVNKRDPQADVEKWIHAVSEPDDAIPSSSSIPTSADSTLSRRISGVASHSLVSLSESVPETTSRSSIEFQKPHTVRSPALGLRLQERLDLPGNRRHSAYS